MEVTLEEFLGVNIGRIKDVSIHMTQPHLIEKIVKDLGQHNPKTTSKSKPAQPSKIVYCHKQSMNFDKSPHYEWDGVQPNISQLI